MDLSHLTHTAAPWFHLLAAAPADARNKLRALERHSGKVAVRFIRGRKATTWTAFFDELAAALQFPDYFGENWDAVNDCLGDLEWIHADAIVLCLLDGDKLLAKAGVFKTVADAIADCSLVVGTTAVGKRTLQHSLRRLEAEAEARRRCS